MANSLGPDGLTVDSSSYQISAFSSGTFTPTFIIEGASNYVQASTTYVAKWTRLNGMCQVDVAASWSNYYVNGGTGAVLFQLPVAFVQSSALQTQMGGTIGVWGSDNVVTSVNTQGLRFQRTATTNSVSVYLYYNYSGDAWNYMRASNSAGPLGQSSGFLNLNFSLCYAV
jgi:hypothetical protein